MYKRKDAFYHKAKNEGYLSRASYKLLEMDKKYKLIKKGGNILDIGAAPGGWSQVALKLIGQSGIVVGVDLIDIHIYNTNNFYSVKGDIKQKDTLEKIINIRKAYDTVISDAAPNTSGEKIVDHTASVELITWVYKITKITLKPGGTFLFKLFEGEGKKPLMALLQHTFETVKTYRPLSTRKNSFEMYIMCKNFMGVYE